MRFILIALSLFGTAYAALPSNEYLPPLEDTSPIVNSDLQSLSESSSPLSEDGYRYKTVKRLRLRHRRDVSELPLNEYLPPVKEAPAVADIPIAIETPSDNEEIPDTILSNDGYHYKTVKRYRYRHRRDLNELPSHEYLPPFEAQTNRSPVPVAVTQEISQDSAVLSDDGYRYKTFKRYRYRNR